MKKIHATAHNVQPARKITGKNILGGNNIIVHGRFCLTLQAVNVPIKPKIEWESLVVLSDPFCVLNIPQEEKDSEDEDEGERKADSKSETPSSSPSCTQR